MSENRIYLWQIVRIFLALWLFSACSPVRPQENSVDSPTARVVATIPINTPDIHIPTALPMPASDPILLSALGDLPSAKMEWQAVNGRYDLVSSSSFVFNLALHDLLVWGMTTAGLAVWDMRTGQSIQYSFLDGLANLDVWGNNQLVADRYGGLWTTRGGELLHYIPGNDGMETIPLPFEAPDDAISQPGLAVGLDERIYLYVWQQYSGDQIAIYDPARNTWILAGRIDAHFYDSDHLTVSPDGIIRFTSSFNDSGTGFLHFDPVQGFVREINDELAYDNAPVSLLAVDPDGRLWLRRSSKYLDKQTTRNFFVGRYDSNARTWENRTPPEWPDSTTPYAALVSPDGSIWFRTEWGLSRYEFSTKEWRHFSLPESSQHINDMLLDKEKVVWLATNSGVAHLEWSGEGDTLAWQVYPLPGISLTEFLFPVISSDGTIWVTDGQQTLGRYDPLQGKWESYYPDETVLPDWKIVDLAAAPDGTIWAQFNSPSGDRHLGRFTPEKHQWKWIESTQHVDRSKFVFSIGTDGFIWFVYQGGSQDDQVNELIRYNPADGDWVIQKLDISTDQTITDLEGDANGFLWLSTQNQLYRYDPVRNLTRIYDVSATLPIHNISHIVAESGEKLWLNTDLGLVVFNLNENSWDVYPQEETPFDGRIESFAVSSNGAVYFGTNGSLFRFTSSKSTPLSTLIPGFVCARAPLTRLQIGMKTQVSIINGVPINVRSQPEIGDNVVATVIEGTPIEIIGGPKCYLRTAEQDALVFWEIYVPSLDITGWAVEGDADGYYIGPQP